MAEELRARLRADLRAAMKARNILETQALRCLIAAIDNAEAVPPDLESTRNRLATGGSPWVATGAFFGAAEVPRRVLSRSELMALLRDEVEKRVAAAHEMDRCARPEQAEHARNEMRIVERYVAQLAGQQ